jgi:putative glutamine amidotransferase
MSRPVIGLSTYLEPAAWGAWSMPAALLPHWYVDLFHEAGFSVVMLPPSADTDAVDRLDGLVLVGGADVDARLYDQEPHATADTPRETRDASEIALYRRARERGMPVLGVCRGMQVMAIAHGGALHQDLPDVSTLVHRERPGHFVDHSSVIEPGTLAASVFGSGERVVNSSHHQAVSDPGDLVVSGRAPDGTVEILEDPSVDFCLGVQWHPEHPDRRGLDKALVDRFREATIRFRTQQQ